MKKSQGKAQRGAKEPQRKARKKAKKKPAAGASRKGSGATPAAGAMEPYTGDGAPPPPDEKRSEIFKLPVHIESYGFRRTTQDWGIGVSFTKEHLHLAQPLEHEINNYFILCLVRIKDKKEVEPLLRDSVDEIEIDP